jgi:RNase P subunit RPR2
MVRVVEKARSKQTTCYKCKTVLEYEFNDIVTTVERDYTGCGDSVSRINCPVCNHKPAVPYWS